MQYISLRVFMYVRACVIRALLSVSFCFYYNFIDDMKL
jgi:hypothetical protein